MPRRQTAMLNPARLLKLLLILTSLPAGPALAQDDESIHRLVASAPGAPFSMQLYEPMRQLGTQRVLDGDYEDSIDAFRYMQNIVHRNYGVYSPRQMESVHLMIQAYREMGDNHDADIQHQFLYTVARHAYAPGEAPMEAARLELATWYRNTLRYQKALKLYATSERYLAKDDQATANLIDVLRAEALTLYLAGRCCASEKLARARELALRQDAHDAGLISLAYADTLWLRRRHTRAASIYKAIGGGKPGLIGLSGPREVIDVTRHTSPRYLPNADVIYVKQEGQTVVFGKPAPPLPDAIGTPMALCSREVTDLVRSSERAKLAAWYVDVDVDVDQAGVPQHIELHGNAPRRLVNYLRAMLKRSYYRPAVTDGRMASGRVSFRESFDPDRQLTLNASVVSWNRLMTVHACIFDRIERDGS